ncbi:MAG: phosphotransferase [Nitrospirae bacterium]|nr:phosphotransferase [Nitrospirota bacterium]
MVLSILSHFDLPGTLIKADRFGAGLINETWLCELSDAGTVRKYILQRINKTVFERPDLVMENVVTVTEHLQSRLRQAGIADPASVTPALVRARDGRSFHIDTAGEYWRVFHFIETGAVYDTVRDNAHAYEVGRGLGRFQALVSDLAPNRLHDTLPGFHHTPRYLAELDEAVQQDAQGRLAAATIEVAFVHARRALAPLLTDLIASGRVPVRVVHNDPKVNNVMVHAATGKALCMLDLDTVKPGIVHFDFGDCVRSAANPAGEDAPDLDKVAFDRSRYAALSRGYRDEARSFLTPAEAELLPASVKVITFELGVRFLADHLRGDTYFRVGRPGHNLHRSRVQFRLLERMEVAGL